LFGNSKFKIFKVFRLLRVLRPLRVISRNEGLQLAMRTLIRAIPSLINLAIVLVVFYLLFGIFCVTFFKGKFYYCYSPMSELETQTKWDCLNAGGEWLNTHLNFDNVFKAVETLFVMSSVSWIKTMWAAVDSRGVDIQPLKNNSIAWTIFFIFLVITFSFFLVNLFVGVVVSTFNQEKERLGKNFLLTGPQKEWLSMKLRCFGTKPAIVRRDEGANFLRRLCLKIANNRKFEPFVLACIIMNTIVLMIKYTNMPPAVENAT